MKTYEIFMTYNATDRTEVEANSLEEAIEIAQNEGEWKSFEGEDYSYEGKEIKK